jgi:hypothetical protein
MGLKHFTENLVPPVEPSQFGDGPTGLHSECLLFQGQLKEGVTVRKCKHTVPEPAKVSKDPVLDGH